MNGYPPSLISFDTPSLAELKLPKGRRRPLGTVRNGDLRKLLNTEITASYAQPAVSEPARRIVSDPLPRRPSTFAKELGAAIKPRPRAASLARTLPKSLHPGKFDSRICERRTCAPTISPPPVVLHVPPRSNDDSSNSDMAVSSAKKRQTSLSSAIPIGTVRPTPLNTSLLSPRSHKTIQGHVTILPSRSLLVDFREGERRRGNAGDQVFIVTHDGLHVKVYEAPHLSSPCCLLEHVSEYDLRSLPPAFWKQYNDAAELMDRIKQRTPKLVLHEPTMKFTLMGNGPLGDVEVLFFSSPVTDGERDLSESTRMRIRVSRQRHTMEIARCKTDTCGKEWMKKSINMSTSASHLDIPPSDLKELDDEDRRAVSSITDFLRLCDSYEQMSQEQMSNCTLATSSTLKQSEKPISTATHTSWRQKSPSMRQVSSSNDEFSSLVCQPSRSVDKENSAPFSNPMNHATHDAVPNWTNLETTTSCSAGVDSRFIPSLGWCIRQSSRVSQGGHYRIMFLDGAAMDVDVDEEWVELRDRTGSVSRYMLRDSKRIEKAIGDRMRVFQQFVTLFESDE